MKFNQTLQVINIERNDIDKEGGEHLVLSMLDNSKLKSVKADSNEFYFKYLEKLDEL